MLSLVLELQRKVNCNFLGGPNIYILEKLFVGLQVGNFQSNNSNSMGGVLASPHSSEPALANWPCNDMLPWGSSSIQQSKLPHGILSKARSKLNPLKSTFDKDCIQISFTCVYYSSFCCNIPFSFVCKISSGVLSIVTFSFLPSFYDAARCCKLIAHRSLYDLCIYQLALYVDLLSINRETGTVLVLHTGDVNN